MVPKTVVKMQFAYLPSAAVLIILGERQESQL